MIYATKRLLAQHLRLVITLGLAWWLVSPFLVAEGIGRWHYAIVYRGVKVAPALDASIRAVHRATTSPSWGIVGYAIWITVAILVIQYLALSGAARRTPDRAAD